MAPEKLPSGRRVLPPVRSATGQTPLIMPRSSYAPWRKNETMAARAVDYLWPWTIQDYPGLRRGVASTLGRHLTWSTVATWLYGRTVPDWALAAFEAEVRARSLDGLRIAGELAAHRAEQAARLRHQPGKLRGHGLDE